MRKLCLSIAAFFFLSACVTSQNYLYVPPQSAEGRQCVESCKQAQDACIAQEEKILADCEKRYRFDQRLYGDCSYAHGSAIEATCISPQVCAPPNTIKCKNDFNACYAACGGEVIPE